MLIYIILILAFYNLDKKYIIKINIFDYILTKLFS